MPARLVITAGAPGSGKSYLLDQMRASGEIDVVLEDSLNEVGKWDLKIPPLKRRLAAGQRVGTCAQAFLQAEMRDLLKTIIGPKDVNEIEWIFFEPDCAACLRNIIKDALRGKGHPYPRTCRVVQIAEKSDIQLPDDTVLRPVFQQAITQEELSTFFYRVPKLKQYNGEDRVRAILGM
jgi:hypothetical protein